MSMHTGQDVDRADILRIVTPFGPLEKDWFASETDREVYQLSKGMFIRFSFFTDCRKAEQVCDTTRRVRVIMLTLLCRPFVTILPTALSSFATRRSTR